MKILILVLTIWSNDIDYSGGIKPTTTQIVSSYEEACLETVVHYKKLQMNYLIKSTLFEIDLEKGLVIYQTPISPQEIIKKLKEN